MYLCDLEDTCQFLGFKATQHGLLSCPELRAHLQFIGVLRYDWAHTFLADSLVGREMWAIIAAGKREGLFDERSVFELLSKRWLFPGQGQRRHMDKIFKSKLGNMFAEWRVEQHAQGETIKASMSELLALYGMLRHFVCLHRSDAIREDVHLFDLACRAVDLVLQAKKRRVPVREAGKQLMAVLEEYMRQRAKLRGIRGVVPKHHWAFDIAECMVSDGFVVDAFAMERLHRRVKPVAEQVCRTTTYEASVMAGVTNTHFNNMEGDKNWSSSCHLLGSLAQMPGAPHIAIADRAMYYSEEFAVGDFVFRGCALVLLVHALIARPMADKSIADIFEFEF